MNSHIAPRTRPSRVTSGARLDQAWLVGLAAGLLGGLAMNLFARTVLLARHGHEAAGAAPGEDRAGRGVQPPQAESAAEDDATVRVARVASRALTGGEPPPSTRPWLGTAVHYAFSATLGAFYAGMGKRFPVLRAAHGGLYGTAVWALADEFAIPLLGLSRRPAQLPAGVHAYALAGHWIYGITLESAVRSARGDVGRHAR